MNANQIINMIIRRVTHLLVNKGVNAGIDLASRRGKPREELTEEERNMAQSQAKQGKDMAKRARQANRITRRLF